MRTRYDCSRLFMGCFPVRGERFALELVADPDPLAFDEADNATLTVRLVTWDLDAETGGLQIRDVKEQELYLGAPLLQASRLPELLEGWARALVRVFESQERLAAEAPAAYEALAERVDYLMPHDLMWACFDALRLKRPRTAADFEEALLGSAKRLGRYLIS
jgi:hypothetical protein